MASKYREFMRKLGRVVEGRRIERKLEQSIYSVDECGDITGYNCRWLITGSEAFEKHLAKEHPEGEHR